MKLTKAIVVLLGMLAASGCGRRVQYATASGPMGTLPFSQAVRVGDMLYLSGQIGTDTTGRLVSGGLRAEARQTLENIKAILERNGATMADVVKCTVMLVDIAEWPALNEIYVTYFPGPKPARSAFAGTGLALGARVEIECWAAVR